MCRIIWWCVSLSVDAERRKVVFRSTEDPVFKLMRTKGLLTDEEPLKASAQTGKNWIEPGDASQSTEGIKRV
jgi:hypothetical protein